MEFYARMLQDKILEKTKLTYLFTLYNRIKIYLHDSFYQPTKGVPQGGINSPILFNFAMYYFLTDCSNRINLRIQLLEQRQISPKVMTPETNFLWADDLASLLRVHPQRAKLWISTYFTIMIEEGQKWGLHINFEKSAVMEMFSFRTNYSFLSDSKTTWIKNKGCSIELIIYPEGKRKIITIPIVIKYKYLGVQISRNLSGKPHLQALKLKTNYIINSFTAIRISSQNVKFCLNTWQVFIRQLLDYSQTLFSQ